jgi:hypothetical protein
MRKTEHQQLVLGSCACIQRSTDEACMMGMQVRQAQPTSALLKKSIQQTSNKLCYPQKNSPIRLNCMAAGNAPTEKRVQVSQSRV